MHIFDTKANDSVLQEMYLANALVNSKDQPGTFYKINLLLKYQNREFKHFGSNYSSFLQEIDKMFRLYALLVYMLRKIRFSINQIIIGWERNDYYPQKNSSFDILSLANQLYKFRSTFFEGPKHSKIYFLKNQISNLINLSLEYLPRAIKAHKEAI